MRTAPRNGSRTFSIQFGFVASLFFAIWPSLSIAEEVKANQEKIQWSFSGELIHYRKSAMKHQPRLRAYHASLEASQAKSKALDDIKVPTLLRRELPIRRQQAEKGIVAATARLQQEEWNTIYDVTRLYLTAIYARTQDRLTDEFLNPDTGIGARKESIKANMDNPDPSMRRPDMDIWDLRWEEALENLVRAEKATANIGVSRALAALREAIGLSWKVQLTLDDTAHLPHMDPKVAREQIIKLALERRGELGMARVGVDVTGLEIAAQQSSRGYSMQTFAAGSDLHADPIPFGSRGDNYQPGAIGLEMPTLLAGSKNARVEQASALYQRAKAVLDKTEQLIALDAEDAYLRWKEAKERFEKMEAARKKACRAVREAQEKFSPFDPKSVPGFNRLTDLQNRHNYLRIQRNEAHFKFLLALARLEHVTAGGFCAGFESIPVQALKPDTCEESGKK